jgi:hypothetical protein
VAGHVPAIHAFNGEAVKAWMPATKRGHDGSRSLQVRYKASLRKRTEPPRMAGEPGRSIAADSGAASQPPHLALLIFVQSLSELAQLKGCASPIMSPY